MASDSFTTWGEIGSGIASIQSRTIAVLAKQPVAAPLATFVRRFPNFTADSAYAADERLQSERFLRLKLTPRNRAYAAIIAKALGDGYLPKANRPAFVCLQCAAEATTG